MRFQLPTSTGATVGFLKHQQYFTTLDLIEITRDFPKPQLPFGGPRLCGVHYDWSTRNPLTFRLVLHETPVFMQQLTWKKRVEKPFPLRVWIQHLRCPKQRTTTCVVITWKLLSLMLGKKSNQKSSRNPKKWFVPSLNDGTPFFSAKICETLAVREFFSSCRTCLGNVPRFANFGGMTWKWVVSPSKTSGKCEDLDKKNFYIPSATPPKVQNIRP